MREDPDRREPVLAQREGTERREGLDPEDPLAGLADAAALPLRPDKKEPSPVTTPELMPESAGCSMAAVIRSDSVVVSTAGPKRAFVCFPIGR